MFFTPSHSTRISLEKEEQRPSPFIPMVYEHVETKPTTWEYRVITIDTSEQPLPTGETLNDLGLQGWMLVGLLKESRTARAEHIHYYFIRQAEK